MQLLRFSSFRTQRAQKKQFCSTWSRFHSEAYENFLRRQDLGVECAEQLPQRRIVERCSVCLGVEERFGSATCEHHLWQLRCWPMCCKHAGTEIERREKRDSQRGKKAQPPCKQPFCETCSQFIPATPEPTSLAGPAHSVILSTASLSRPLG